MDVTHTISLERVQSINRWIDDVNWYAHGLRLGDIEEIVFRLQNIKMDVLEYNGKENNRPNSKKLEDLNDIIPDIFSTSSCDEMVGGGVNLYQSDQVESHNVFKSTKENSSLNASSSICQFWRFDDPAIENRLHPQRFNHHKLTEDITNMDYDFTVKQGCPSVTFDKEYGNLTLMQNKNLREIAYHPKYERKTKLQVSHSEYLCRMCSSKRWVSTKHFAEHMALSHGIVDVKEVGIVAMPLPAALYRQTLGRLKFFYCKCPKCIQWIRLGKTAEISNLSDEVIELDYLNDRPSVGFYTNYFYHFMGCSLENIEHTRS